MGTEAVASVLSCQLTVSSFGPMLPATCVLQASGGVHVRPSSACGHNPFSRQPTNRRFLTCLKKDMASLLPPGKFDSRQQQRSVLHHHRQRQQQQPRPSRHQQQQQQQSGEGQYYAHQNREYGGESYGSAVPVPLAIRVASSRRRYVYAAGDCCCGRDAIGVLRCWCIEETAPVDASGSFRTCTTVYMFVHKYGCKTPYTRYK